MNTQRLTILTLALGMLVMLATGSTASAAQGKDDAGLSELRERFKKRHPEIQQLKRDGIVGETSEGYVDFVQKRPEKPAAVVDAENKDRKTLYIILAEQEGVDAVIVATRSAKRNFERAKPGEYLKEGGSWRKKT